MDEKILRLKDLQQITLALRALEMERQQGPLRLASLEQAFDETSQTVGGVKHRHDGLKEETATLEVELRDFQQKLVKYQAQLMEVKNSKEYSAVLKEIDAAKAEISRRDEELLAKMQEMESLQKDLPEVEARLAVEMDAFNKERATIEQEMERSDQKRARLEADRQRLEALLPREVLLSFYRVAEARHGVGMVRVTEAVCSACNVRLRPQVFSEVRRGDQLLSCDSCRRFLYYEPTDSAAPSQDAGPPRV